MTSGGMQGMDTEYARQAAQSMDGGVSQIQGVTAQVGQLLDHIVFNGPFASGFKEDWHGNFAQQLANAHQTISEHAQYLRAKADQQDAASGS